MNGASTPSGSVAIVTGAGDGIGWAVATRLAEDHAHIVVLDQREEASLARAAELGADHMGVAADVTSEDQVAAAVALVLKRFGRIDVLVNNAGIGEQAVPTTEQTVEGFDRVLQVHLRGTFLLSRAVAPTLLAQRRGAIVNLGSIAGVGGIPGRNAYGAAKAGIISMTRAMACEWARQGVRVNAVSPGYVRTALVEELARRGALDMDAIAARTPLGRLATAGEVAEVVAFLASSKASFVTGANFMADGGWSALAAPEGVLGAYGDS